MNYLATYLQRLTGGRTAPREGGHGDARRVRQVREVAEAAGPVPARLPQRERNHVVSRGEPRAAIRAGLVRLTMNTMTTPTRSNATPARCASPASARPARRSCWRRRVTLCGCGALGTVLANTLVRAGVGFVRIIDRDFVEPSNLQRQVLFDESDVANNLPKAEAAARKLRQINSSVTVEPIVADINRTNIEELCQRRRPDPRRHATTSRSATSSTTWR